MKKCGTKYYQYFVEGEDEKKIINTLKSDMGLIQAGKVQVVNCVQLPGVYLYMRLRLRATRKRQYMKESGR